MPFFNDGREAALHAHILSLPQEPLHNNPSAILAAMDTYISKHRMMTFSTNKIAKSRQILEQMDPKPNVVLELGTYVGNSALAWGSILRGFHGLNAAEMGCKVITCELESSFLDIASDFVRLGGLQDIVQIEQGKAEDTIRRLHGSGVLSTGGVDMLFIDHWEDAYLPDLKVVEELGLLRKGGVVIADNTDIPGAPEYLAYLRSVEGERYRSETIAGEVMDEEGMEKGKEDGKGNRKKKGGHGGKPNVLEISWVL